MSEDKDNYLVVCSVCKHHVAVAGASKQLIWIMCLQHIQTEHPDALGKWADENPDIWVYDMEIARGVS